MSRHVPVLEPSVTTRSRQTGALNLRRVRTQSGSAARTDSPGHRLGDVSVLPLRIQRQPTQPEAANPLATAQDVGNLPFGLYADRYEAVYYDIDYRSEGGNLSKYLTAIYSDGTVIDVRLDRIETGAVPAEQMLSLMRNATVGDGGRIFPQAMNASTTPRLAAAKRSAIQTMEEYNFQLMQLTVPAVLFVITMPFAAMSPTATATRTPVTRLPFRIPAGAAGDVFEQTLKAGLRPNTIRHIFGKAEHGLAPSGVVQQLGGEQQVIQAAVTSLRGVSGALPMAGRYEVVVMIAGRSVTIRGAVVNGVPRISTMFIRPGG